MRRALVFGLCAALYTGFAEAQPADTTPAVAAEKSQIKPVGERKLGARQRPTHKKKVSEQQKDARATRVSLQIPERLRKSLERRIDARIAWNIKAQKKLRNDAMVLLRKFVAESPEDSDELPEALMRLGELEWEDSRDKFLAAFNAWEKKPQDQRGEPPSPDYATPRGRFLRVLRNFKTFRSYDLALYVDGFLANEEGKFEEALGRFNKILEWFPKSRFVPDAHMVRAEFEFTKDAPNYQTALQEYEEVLKYKDSGLYDIALFKSAWCLWRLGQTDIAAQRFLAVFKDSAEAGQGERSREEIDELQREALKNLVAVFVEDEKNRAEDMHKFLVRAGGDKFAGRIVRALADALYEQAHYERGIEAYKLLLRLEPMDPEAYKHALAVAQGHSTMEGWKKLKDEYRVVIAEYVPPAPPRKGKKPKRAGAWTRAQNPTTLTASTRAVKAQLKDDAVGLHAKAQADKTSKGQFEGAAGLYEVYLERFGRERDSYELHYNVAEIYLYQLGKEDKAADSYLAAVRLNPKGKLSRDALYNALAALERARAREFEARRAEGKKQEESPLDKQLTEAMELYVTTYPNDPAVPELLFRQGKLYYDYEVYDPAVRQWGLLLEKYPSSSFAAGAGELILDSFNKSRDYENIETWARRLKTAPSFMKPEQQARLNTLIIQAVFKQGEQHADAGRHDKAAQAYLRAATEFPKERRAAQAAVNAQVSARRAADLVTLKAAAAILIANHKDKPEAAQGLWIAATTHQEIGLFSDAAEYHDVIVDNFPKYEHHKDAAFNAVLLRTTVGEHAKAIESGNKFKRLYGRDESADEVTFLMGKAHEKAEKWTEAEQLYATYAKSARRPSSQVEAYARLASVRLRANDVRGADGALASGLKVYRQRKGGIDESGRYFAAKARYMQGERILQDYERVKIEGEVKQLKERLKRKSELLKRAADTFLDTAEMGVAEWTTASLYQIGFTYESFSKALLNSPPPASLSAQDKELYSQQIDEFVIPIEERALEAYESGWLKARELGIFNSWTAKMREALGRLNSELFPPLKEIGFEIRSRGPSALPPLIDGPRRSKAQRSEAYLVPVEDPPALKAKPKGGEAEPAEDPEAKSEAPASEDPKGKPKGGKK